jgi:hypothetical protein
MDAPRIKAAVNNIKEEIRATLEPLQYQGGRRGYSDTGAVGDEPRKAAGFEPISTPII